MAHVSPTQSTSQADGVFSKTLVPLNGNPEAASGGSARSGGRALVAFFLLAYALSWA
jgi:hypothetical protein